MSAHTVDVAIIGGGAAGLFCAAECGKRGLSVAVIEHANKVGKKILMSGGGRCNFTNLGALPEHYLSDNPHFCKSALARYSPYQFLDLVEKHGIAWCEKDPGQLFCVDSSKQIVRMLLDECAQGNVTIQTDWRSTNIRAHASGFNLSTNRGSVACKKLVIATGGLSIPSMGASGYGYDVARQFGHDILPTRAGLVPLTITGKHAERLQGLSGVATPITASTDDASFSEPMLITHRGISGPAILQISSFWQPGQALHIDLMPQQNAHDWFEEQRAKRPDAQLHTVLGETLPKRLAQRLCDVWLGDKPLKQHQHADIDQLAQVLHHWPIQASGTEGYRTAEVTLGGINTDGISSTTFESKHQPNLHFIGEVLDVTGWLGGYNFQWAWASAHAVAEALGAPS